MSSQAPLRLYKGQAQEGLGILLEDGISHAQNAEGPTVCPAAVKLLLGAEPVLSAVKVSRLIRRLQSV